MDPVTIATAIAATRALVKGASGVKDIAQGLDQLFHAQSEQVKKETKKKKGAPTSRMQQVIGIRSGDQDFDDDTSMGTVAADVLEQKQLDLNMAALKKEVDSKWGIGTWSTILQERDNRIKKKKALHKQRVEAARQRAEENKALFKKIMTEILKAATVILFAGAMIWFIWWAATTDVDVNIR